MKESNISIKFDKENNIELVVDVEDTDKVAEYLLSAYSILTASIIEDLGRENAEEFFKLAKVNTEMLLKQRNIK